MSSLDDPDLDDRLSGHLRRTLHAVADTVVDGSPVPMAAPPAEMRGRARSGRRLVAALAAVAVLIGVAIGWNQLDEGEIVRIPTDAAVMSGTADEGGRWWLIPSAIVHPGQRSDGCDPPTAAVDYVSEASNRPGQEWNTGGVAYGEPPAPPEQCHDEAAWLAAPPLFSMGSTRLGPSDDGGDDTTAWGYYLAVHPTITRVRVTVDEDPSSVVATVALPRRPDGPRFAAFTTPADTGTVSIELISADGRIVSKRTWDRGG